MSPPQHGASRTSLHPHAQPHTRRALPNHTRAQKPPPLTSRKSSTFTPSKKSPIGRAGFGWSKNAGKKEESAEADEDDMTGLPQFCATCEKQIIAPGQSILYCSESCKRKDHNKPLSESLLPSDFSPGPPSSRRASYFGELYDVSPMASPVHARPPSIALSDTSEASSGNDGKYYPRSDSEAARYFQQFREPGSLIDFASARPDSGVYRVSSSASMAPSLSHTPASTYSTSGSYMSFGRPLPRRGDPWSASFSSYSTDLITPVMNSESMAAAASLNPSNASVKSSDSTNTQFRIVDGGLTYGKQPCMPDSSGSRGSLKQLFSHEAMQAPPRPASRQSLPALDFEEDQTVNFENE